jgi:hypothetical protein
LFTLAGISQRGINQIFNAILFKPCGVSFGVVNKGFIQKQQQRVVLIESLMLTSIKSVYKEDIPDVSISENLKIEAPQFYS